MKQWNSEIFPTTKQMKGVIFFLCAHDTRLKSYKFAIKQLLRQGYEVVGYEFDPTVIHSGDPNVLPRFVDAMRQEVETVIENKYNDSAIEVGIFGNSIGTFIGYNILDIPQVNWVIMNTGGNMARGFWRLPRARRAFEENGVTLGQLELAWHRVQNPKWHNPKGKRVLFLSSTGDKLATIEDALTAHEYMLKHGVNSKFVRMRRLNHQHTIMYNLTRAGRLLSLLPNN